MISKQQLCEILSSKSIKHHYIRRYVNFIFSCKDLVLEDEYSEKHHICPKAKDLFPEFSSFKEHPWNCIRLSPRHHYIAHLMLHKIYGGSMTFALHCLAYMSNSSQNRRRSRLYESVKLEYSKLVSQKNSERMKKVGEEGRHHWQTEEFREIRKEETREKNIQKVKDGSHPWLKGNRSEEHRKKLSDAKKGNQNAAGNVHSEETKRIISERTPAAVKGKPKKRGICSGCGKETSLANLTLYHVKSCGHIKDSV